jgi:hypothetical protein
MSTTGGYDQSVISNVHACVTQSALVPASRLYRKRDDSQRHTHTFPKSRPADPTNAKQQKYWRFLLQEVHFVVCGGSPQRPRAGVLHSNIYRIHSPFLADSSPSSCPNANQTLPKRKKGLSGQSSLSPAPLTQNSRFIYQAQLRCFDISWPCTDAPPGLLVETSW